MKQNSLLFFVLFGLSFGLSLLIFRCRDASQEQHRIETVRLKLESDLNRLLKTRQIADISTIIQSNPVQQHTHVECQLDDGAKVGELDLGAYLHQVLIEETVQRFEIKAMDFDANHQIQTLILTKHP